MKKLVLTAAASLACVAAFAQGKVQFSNDSNHLVYFDATVPGVGGTAAYAGNVPSDVTALAADIYMGTSSSSLTYYSSATFSAIAPGKWNAVNVSASNPLILGGSSVYIVAQVRDSGGSAEATLDTSLISDVSSIKSLGAANSDSYIGFSQMFTFTLGSSISYPVMYSGTSTWQAGTFDLSATAGAGAKGAIAVYAVPEPATFALAGLGMAGMLIFRRRKA